MAQKTYDCIADRYDDIYSSKHCHVENQLVAGMLKQVLPPTRPILDVGCGTGLLLDLLPQLAVPYMGIDPAPKMLEALKVKHPHANVLCSKYEDVSTNSLRDGNVIVSLFGSPSYISPEDWDLKNLSGYFLMFLKDGYFPVSHQNGVELGMYKASAFDFSAIDCRVIEFSEYVIVTDLGG